MTTGSAYAKVNGLEMYYELHGSDSGRRPLVLLHGGVLTIGLSFGAVLPALAARAGSWLPSCRATGTPPTSSGT